MKHNEIIYEKNGKVILLDQTKLPFKFEYLTLINYHETANAIKNMNVRGAGTIGIAAAYAMAQAFSEFSEKTKILKAKAEIESTRPTAQNLFYSTNLVYSKAILSNNPKKMAWEIANNILKNDIHNSKLIGKIGAELIEDGFGILTHCNAGKLAIQGYGSATAPIYLAFENGKKNIFVFVDETRPRLQGSRLTAWELAYSKIPHAIIVDNAAGYYMQKKKIDIVFVGADRISVNGDVANKIGTYEKAVVAKENNIPFYVAAPSSTIDMKCKTGNEIIIEERESREVREVFGKQVANGKSKILNPAFDVTPAKYINGIITENGIFKPSELITKL
ncbi:MAG: S-methyl-5-thioribose-1-phosphate isomerase [Candidatus Marinimicrobia bacterium]|nr:S-methyl-5-thioribose-1-phosphate isomerase [Candidatus Neomarinimicrobiota bacterium]